MTASIPAPPDHIQTRQIQAIINGTITSRRRQLAEMRDALTRIDRLVAPAVIAMETRNDGWPTRKGDGGSGGSGISNPVMSQTIAISHLLELDSQIRLLFVTATESTKTLEAMLHRMAAYAPDLPVEATNQARCSAGLHLPGYESWGKRDASGVLARCDEIPDVNPDTGKTRRGGLCTGCYYRSYKWLRDHGPSNMAAG